MKKRLLKRPAKHFMLMLCSLLATMAISIHAGAQCTNSGVALAATTTASNIACAINDGSITVNANKGWTDATAGNGTGYTYAITAGPLTRPTQSGNVFAALPVGTYTISITDCHGDVITKSATVAGALTALSTAPTTIPSICPTNNAIKVNPSGGKAPYTITCNAPSYTVSGDTIKGLSAGAITYTVTDACGNQISAMVTATTTTLTTFTKSWYWAGCAGALNPTPAHQTAVALPTITWALNLPITTVLDSFYVDMYFNGAFVGTDGFFGSNANNFPFPAQGFGLYTFVTRNPCLGQIGRDSFTVGNRPGGTNIDLGISLPGTSAFQCTTFNMVTNVFDGIGPNSNPLANYTGQVYDVMSAYPTITILSGPAGASVKQVNAIAGNAITTLTLDSLPYGTYTFKVTDPCGVMDTLTYTQNPKVFSASPDVSTCNFTSLKPGTIGFVVTNGSGINLFPNLPSIPPITYRFLSGPAIWASYPFTIVDSVSSNAVDIGDLPPGGSYTIQASNGCGNIDTIIVTPTCTPAPYVSVSTSVTPHCGNLGDITVTTSAGTETINKISAPAGNTVANSGSSFTALNQPSGTYVFRLIKAAFRNTNFGGVTTPFYDAFGNAVVGGVASPFPTTYPFYTNINLDLSVGRSDSLGVIDTSQLHSYDTTFTVVVPQTNLIPTAKDNYLCEGGTTTNVLVGNPQGVPPFTYKYSTVSNAGPFSASQPDSLLQVSSVTQGQQIYLQTTDACGNTATVNSTVAALAATFTSSCSSGVASISLNPFNGDFIYQLKQVSTGNTTTYTYPTVPSVDLSNPLNAGAYTLSYRLASAGSTSCTVDSINLVLAFPCIVVILPVRLLGFDATATAQGGTLVSWATASETNTASFAVQRSADGTHWETIGTVAAAGNATTEKQYSFTDAEPSAGNNYYRLKTTDNTGSSSFSEIKLVQFGAGNWSARLSPNPVAKGKAVQIKSNRPLAMIRVIDANGQAVFTKTATTQSLEYSINATNFAAGIYNVQLTNSNGKTMSLKLIINH